MKRIICFIISVSIPAISQSNDKICTETIGISAPVDTSKTTPFFNKINAICVNGIDISNKIKKYKDDIITSSFPVHDGDSSLYFVSLYSEIKYHGRIEIIYYNNNELQSFVIYQNKQGVRENNPNNSIDGITINFFDEKTKNLYFTVNSYATTGQVNYLHWNGGLDFKKYNLHDGIFKGFFNGMPIVSTIRHDEKGAYFPSYLIKDDEVFCTIDTRPKYWTLSPNCLSSSDNFKER